ncbi:MAG: alpha/beta hydrolase-fold protein [Candidatus Delongbacteria bacterium]
MSLGFLNERLRGTVVVDRLESRLLAGNPLGDPAVRHLPVYLPPAYHTTTARYPLVMILGGLFGSAAGWLAFRSFDENVLELADRLIAAGALPPAVLAFPDCSTRYGGGQYLDSPGTGRYLSHLADEVLPLLEAHYRLRGDAAGRAVAGRSSGGFGALRLVMARPGLFAHCASGSGDLYFEMSARPELARLPSALERLGGLDEFLRGLPALRHLGSDEACVLNVLAQASSYSPSDTPPGFRLPIDPESGELDEEVFALWKTHDPAERVLTNEPERAALAGLQTLYVEAGDRDEYHADLGARVFAQRCRLLGIDRLYHSYPGGHSGGTARWAVMLPLLLERMN